MLKHHSPSPASSYARERPKPPSHCDVVVIGAGVSGLRAAADLKRVYKLNAVVLEARDLIGGRVRQDTDFLPGVEVEMGAEFIHGDLNNVIDLVEEHNWGRRQIFTWSHGDGGPAVRPAPDGGNGYYFLGAEGRLLRSDDEDADFYNCNEALWGLGSVDAASADSDPRTLRQYLKDVGVTDAFMALADAGYANTQGGTLDSVPVSHACKLERAWEGEGTQFDPDFRMSPSYRVLIDHLSEGTEIHTGCPVASIHVDTALAPSAAPPVSVDWTGAGEPPVAVLPAKHAVRVVCADGSVVHAHRVIVTVPLPILRDGEIAFHPPLSPAKVAAAQSLSFANGIKVLLKFNRRVWPADCHGTVCADSFLPECWMNGTRPVGALIVGKPNYLEWCDEPVDEEDGGEEGEEEEEEEECYYGEEDVGSTTTRRTVLGGLGGSGDSSSSGGGAGTIPATRRWATSDAASLAYSLTGSAAALSTAAATTISAHASSSSGSAPAAPPAPSAAVATATAAASSGAAAAPSGSSGSTGCSPSSAGSSSPGEVLTMSEVTSGAIDRTIPPVEPDVFYVCTGFVMGSRADAVAAEPQATVVARFLSQLDTMFGMDAPSAFLGGYVHSWADEPYIRGAYVTPTVKDGAGAAKVLAEPHAGGTVFFAGEATAGAIDAEDRETSAHFCSPIVLHGSMETGTAAACDVARSLGLPVSCKRAAVHADAAAAAAVPVTTAAAVAATSEDGFAKPLPPCGSACSSSKSAGVPCGTWKAQRRPPPAASSSPLIKQGYAMPPIPVSLSRAPGSAAAAAAAAAAAVVASSFATLSCSNNTAGSSSAFGVSGGGVTGASPLTVVTENAFPSAPSSRASSVTSRSDPLPVCSR